MVLHRSHPPVVGCCVLPRWGVAISEHLFCAQLRLRAMCWVCLVRAVANNIIILVSVRAIVIVVVVAASVTIALASLLCLLLEYVAASLLSQP